MRRPAQALNGRSRGGGSATPALRHWRAAVSPLYGGRRPAEGDHEGRDGERSPLVEAESVRAALPEVEEQRVAALQSKSTPALGKPKSGAPQSVHHPVRAGLFTDEGPGLSSVGGAARLAASAGAAATSRSSPRRRTRPPRPNDRRRSSRISSRDARVTSRSAVRPSTRRSAGCEWQSPPFGRGASRTRRRRGRSRQGQKRHDVVRVLDRELRGRVESGRSSSSWPRPGPWPSGRPPAHLRDHDRQDNEGEREIRCGDHPRNGTSTPPSAMASHDTQYQPHRRSLGLPYDRHLTPTRHRSRPFCRKSVIRRQASRRRQDPGSDLYEILIPAGFRLVLDAGHHGDREAQAPSARPAIPTAHESHERLGRATGMAVFASDALPRARMQPRRSCSSWSSPERARWPRRADLGGDRAMLAIVVVVLPTDDPGLPGAAAAPTSWRAKTWAHYPSLVAGAALLTVTCSRCPSAWRRASPRSPRPCPSLSPLPDRAVVSRHGHRVANLRGVRESGACSRCRPTPSSPPSYALIAWGLRGARLRGAVCRRPERAATVPPQEALTVFLVLRAFASGCVALTGIEAVSDGVPAFRPPEARNARQVLVMLGTILITFFIGITFLAHDVWPHPRGRRRRSTRSWPAGSLGGTTCSITWYRH